MVGAAGGLLLVNGWLVLRHLRSTEVHPDVRGMTVEMSNTGEVTITLSASPGVHFFKGQAEVRALVKVPGNGCVHAEHGQPWRGDQALRAVVRRANPAGTYEVRWYSKKPGKREYELARREVSLQRDGTEVPLPPDHRGASGI